MSEWNYDKSGVQVGIPFLAEMKYTILFGNIYSIKHRILTKINSGEYIEIGGGTFDEEDIKAWMPLTYASNKKHYCISKNDLMKCSSDPYGNLYVSIKDSLTWCEVVNFCPFCGEEANKE